MLKTVDSSIKYCVSALVLCACFFVSSCNKDDTCVIGQVWDISTDAPYSGAQVSLRETESDLSGGGGEGSVITTATTDNNGNFSLEFNSKSRTKFNYFIQLDYDNLMYTGWDNFDVKYKYDIEKKDENSIKFLIGPAAGINILTNNVTPFDMNDKITVFARHYLYNYEKVIYTSVGNSQSGIKDYVSVIRGEIIIKWDVTKNSITQTYKDTVNLAHDQKFDYTINY